VRPDLATAWRLDPNDWHYDRVLGQEIKRLDPRELDRLMRECGDDDEA
jgi:hypothetical protein